MAVKRTNASANKKKNIPEKPVVATPKPHMVDGVVQRQVQIKPRKIRIAK